MMIDAMGLERQFPDQKNKIGLLAPLTGPHGDKGTIIFLNSIMLYKQSKNPNAAKTFLKWWSANEKPLWIEGKCDQLPVRRSIAADPYFQSDPTTRRILEEWVPIGKGTGARAQTIFPALNEVEGGGSVMALLQDLLQRKDAIPSMRRCEAELSKVV
jgi:multiple sugar transport system substrate-binding protein